jgi:hypothetical protein
MRRIIELKRLALLSMAGTILFQPAMSGQSSVSPGTTPSPQVRMKWQDFTKGPEGAKRLASLQKAVAKMKSLSTSTNKVDYMRSWDYWANIHGYYGPNSRDGTVEDIRTYILSVPQLASYISYFDGINDRALPDDGVAAVVWATCEHSQTDNQGNLTKQANFWGWHRMYLYYFERVIRWAAQDDTLRLPYWDYTDPRNTALPAEFQKVDSILYDSKRDPTVNQGAPLDPDSTNADAALKEPSYLAAEWGVEKGVHGNVHCETAVTCPIAYMGDVPVAANDPIFYHHHANIDRLWACWQNSHPPVGPAAWEDEKFSFPDETGTLKTRPVGDFLSTASLGYVYDNIDKCLRVPAAHALRANIASQGAQKLEESLPVVVGSALAVTLTQSKTSVDIAVPRQMMLSMSQPATQVSTRLVLRQITAQSPPGAVLKVYVEAKGKPERRKYVATISWFNAFGSHKQGPDVQTLSYDVSDQLKELGVKTETAGLTVTFEAATGRLPIPASPSARLKATAQTAAFRPEAKLMIGAVELRQESTTP